MRITESRLRSIIQDILRENDLQRLSQTNNPSEEEEPVRLTYKRKHTGNVSEEDLKDNFKKVIKIQTNLYNMISHYTEKNEEIPSEVLHAFGVIVSAMYEKSFPVKLSFGDRRYIKELINELIFSYANNVTIDL